MARTLFRMVKNQIKCFDISFTHSFVDLSYIKYQTVHSFEARSKIISRTTVDSDVDYKVAALCYGTGGAAFRKSP